MCQMKVLIVITVAVVVCVQHTGGRPYRQKRISDHRLAELETLIALAQMRNKMVTIPVGFGQVDPVRMGRRKRSIDLLMRFLLEDLSNRDNGLEQNEDDDEKQQQQTKQEDGESFENEDTSNEDEIYRDIDQWIENERKKIARYRGPSLRFPE